MKPKQIIGRKTPRKRILDDDELKAYWRAAANLGYPYGPIFRLLALTGQRKSEIAEARRSEISDARSALEIPAERYKTDEAHVVPLCEAACAIIADLPRFEGGDYLFSTTEGAKPVRGFSGAKKRLDAEIAGIMGKEIEPFVIHDVRRTMRTHLSALPIPQHVAERIIGHAQPGLIKTYDRWSFLEEKRAGLNMWEDRLLRIVGERPDGGNVISIARRRG